MQLRAQFTHLDALNADKRRLTSLSGDRPNELAREDRIEDVNMMVKETVDSDNTDMYGGMQETSRLLRSIREEPWQRLRWIDTNVRLPVQFDDSLLIFAC